MLMKCEMKQALLWLWKNHSPQIQMCLSRLGLWQPRVLTPLLGQALHEEVQVREANQMSQFQQIIATFVREFPLLLWLALHCWPKGFLLGCSGRLGFGFRSGWGLFGFRLQGCEAQDLAVLVALVQGFELVNEGSGTVSFEAFISEKKWMNTSICILQLSIHNCSCSQKN